MRVTIKCIVHHFCSLGLTLNVIKLSKLSFIICTLSSCYVVYVCLSLPCSLSVSFFLFLSLLQMMVLLLSVVILSTMPNSLFDLLGLYHVTLTYSFYFSQFLLLYFHNNE